MNKIKLRDMMWQRRIRSLAELSRNAGISRQTVDALYNRPEQEGFRSTRWIGCVGPCLVMWKT